MQKQRVDGDLEANDYRFGPYPHGRLINRTGTLVQFETAPHSEGLGTTRLLKEGDEPIDSVAFAARRNAQPAEVECAPSA